MYFETMRLTRIYNKVRSGLRTLYLSLIGHFVTPYPCVVILSGHMIDWDHDSNEDGLRFYNLLLKLKEKCDFVNIEDAVSLITRNVKVKKSTIAFAFDDGWRDCYTQIAPQLERFGINAAFFINPNFVEALENDNWEYIDNFTNNVTRSPGKLPMTWEQIKDLHRRGFVIGAHTLDHYCINSDDVSELYHQIIDCKYVIERMLGTQCEYFAFPYGQLEHANQKSIKIACDAYQYVFSQGDYKHYYSYDGKVINRRHFEPFWPFSHVKYFISKRRS